jgi:uncharacterized membrane protein
MPFDASKYLGKQKKKRSFRDKMRIKWYAHKKQTARKYREYDKKNNVNKTINKSENNNVWYDILVAVTPYIVCFTIFYLFKFHRETTISILLLILYGIGWLIGIVLAFVVSKMFFLFLYRTSVNIASNFVVDVLDEVDKKRAKRQDNNF